MCIAKSKRYISDKWLHNQVQVNLSTHRHVQILSMQTFNSITCHLDRVVDGTDQPAWCRCRLFLFQKLQPSRDLLLAYKLVDFIAVKSTLQFWKFLTILSGMIISFYRSITTQFWAVAMCLSQEAQLALHQTSWCFMGSCQHYCAIRLWYDYVPQTVLESLMHNSRI